MNSKASYEVAALLLCVQLAFAVQMSFYGITVDYNEPLKLVNAHTESDTYKMGVHGSAGESP